jgi:hypothetical protein
LSHARGRRVGPAWSDARPHRSGVVGAVSGVAGSHASSHVSIRKRTSFEQSRWRQTPAALKEVRPQRRSHAVSSFDEQNRAVSVSAISRRPRFPGGWPSLAVGKPRLAGGRRAGPAKEPNFASGSTCGEAVASRVAWLAHICRGAAGGRTGSALNQCDVGLPVDRPRAECVRRWTCIALFVGDLVVARSVQKDRSLAYFRCART